MKKLLSFLFFCGVALSAVAYSFEVDGIYYSITSSSTCEVYNNGNYNSYSGDVSIPASVTYGGNTYSVTSIGIYAFCGCSSLTSVTIPSSVTSIEDSAFYGCSSLTSVTIPSSVTSIEDSAFGDCSSLTSVTIPEGVTSIGIGAFFGCSSLTSVSIPETVTKVGHYVFNNTPWYNSQEDGLLYLDDWLLGFKGSEPEGVLIIKDGTKGIAQHAFRFCSSLTSVTIPEGVTNIGDYTFYGCSSLTGVTIPEGVTDIYEYAFYGCSSLTSVTIPSSVTSIGNYAFSDCSSLTSVTMKSDIPCTLGYSPFDAFNDGFKITVPYGSGDAYKNATRWSKYADYIVEMPLADYLYMEDSKTFHKSQLTIPVQMKNAKPFTAFQCDITLPEGLTLHKTMNEDDEEVFDIAYGSRAKSSHSLMANQLTNGNVRVAGYSSSNADYRDSEGMFFTLTVDVANDASGDLPIKLSNVILTSATDGDTECPDTEAVLTIIPGQPGDVNGDGKLTMGDVVKLVNNILEVSQTGFNADLADVNEDGKVTMGDVVIVLNMILSGEYPIKAPSMRQPMAKDEVEDDTVL